MTALAKPEARSLSKYQAIAEGHDRKPWDSENATSQEQTDLPPPQSDDDAALTRLAKLSPLEYDRCREAEAENLGVRVGTLDKLVGGLRRESSGDDLSGVAVTIEDEDQYPASVDGAALLGELVATLRRHAIVPDGAALAIALWIFGTYVYDEFALFPKLLITSPEKRCGKSTLATIIGALVSRGLPCSNITAPALFRCIEKWKPTLLLDEADTFIKENEELRGIVNAGHTRASAYVIRLCGDDHEPRKFSVWAPMLIAMIRLPADTIVDRSVTVQMRRKLPGETVTKLPVLFRDDCRVIRQKLTRWAADHVGSFEHTPTVPNHSNDRTVDNWSPLFSIVNAIGGAWPDRLRKSFELMNADIEDDSAGPRILSDIRQIFRDKGIDRIFSDDLVTALCELDEAPWSEWKRGKPITQNSLARMLKNFKVQSGEVRIGYHHRKGYQESDFSDAFARYLSDTPIQSATTRQANNGAASSDFQSATTKTSVAVAKPLKPSNDAACRVVADEKGALQRRATHDLAEGAV
jgi:putative DNA primase/helicase